MACRHPVALRVTHRVGKVGPTAQTCGSCQEPLPTPMRPELAPGAAGGVRGAGAVIFFGLLGGV